MRIAGEGRAMIRTDVDGVMEAIVGMPDFAVWCCVGSWPDGGYIASCVLIDVDHATQQGLVVIDAGLSPADRVPGFDVFKGFVDGVTDYGRSPNTALVNLYNKLLAMAVKRESVGPSR